MIDPKFSRKNRYSDILTYRHSRIDLKPRESCNDSMFDLKFLDPEYDSYINANFIDVSSLTLFNSTQSPLAYGDRKIIAAQGPTPNTVVDFWRMIVQENVSLVISVCNLFEDNRPKCEKYWPDDKETVRHLKSSGIVVTPSSIEQLSQHLTLRKMIVDDELTQTKQREVQHLHYTGWPDHGVPSGQKNLESFKNMIDYFIWTILKSDQSQKIIVHCSAGIGRTGTTIGLAHLILNTWAQKN